MGLDMYLSRKSYVKNWDHMKPENRVVITMAHEDGSPVNYIDMSKIKEISEEIAYWRKVNWVHHWFVENVQEGKDECQEAYVEREQLQTLVDLCHEAIDDKNTDLLPPVGGFFFGGTEIDDEESREYYFDTLQDTIDQIEPYLADKDSDKHGSFYYQSSW